MGTMVKNTRMSEVFTSGQTDAEKIYKTTSKTTTFYCSNQTTTSQGNSATQLLNRQKNTTSLKNLNTVEHIEFEALKDTSNNSNNDMPYHYSSKHKETIIDSYRDSDFIETDDGMGKFYI